MLFVSGSVFGQDSINLKLPISRHERKKQDEFIKENIIGKWKDQNSILYFYPKNTYSIIFDDGKKESGFWEIKKSKIILTVNPSHIEYSYAILYFTKFKMKYKATDHMEDQTIWEAIKVGKF